ncbi:MAG: ATP-dependent RNA helicase HrpA, partial [Burkholderiales bacterium]
TSLTVPGIKYVIDSGLARVNRYSYRNKVEMLQIEKISRASANQRAGRCGRVMSGVCVRLYSEEDFAQRTEFTDPEILRSSLAGVILRMKLLKLGEPEEFPFVDAPSPKAIADGYQLLGELGAVDDDRRLTPVGAQLAKLPVDPRVARMIVAAKEEGCLAEVLIIAAGLAIRDPRERPLEKQEAADSAHAQFLDERSEFLGLLKLWTFFGEAIEHKKSNRLLVKLCHDNFLSYVRLREWRELHGQLAANVGELGWRENEKPARPEEIHRALLAGLLGNIGFKSEEAGVYLGARGIKFSIFPGSALRKKGPPWLMAAELTETTKLYARCNAPIDPAWLEKTGKHLVKRTYLDPHWEKKSAQAIAFERVTLYGLVVVPKRRVSYGPIDPVEARKIFIREALVHGHYELEAPFLSHNLALRRDVEDLEHKSRRHDVLVDDEVVYGFYDERIPHEIWSGQQFEKWRREAERKEPKLLFATRELLMRHAASEINEERFPDSLDINGVSYELKYRFEPGHALDGVTMLVPLHLLNQVDERRCEWLVPGMLRDKLTHLIKALPKGLRKNFVPVPQYVSKVLDHLEPAARPLCPEIGAALLKVAGVQVPNDAWDESDLPVHLTMNYQVVGDGGQEAAMSRDIAQLRSGLGVKARRQFSESARGQFERQGITHWDFPDLPEQIEFIRDGQRLIGYPAITDEGKSVALKVLDTDEEAQAATHRGLRRLFQLALPDQVKHMARSLPNFQEMSLRYAIMLDLDSGKSGGRGSDKGAIADRLRDELVEAICDRAFFVEEVPIRTKAAFQERVNKAKVRMHDVTLELCRLANEIFTVYQEVRAKLNTPSPQAWHKTLNDIRAQIKELIPSGFLANVPLPRMRHYPRYLKAMLFRIGKIASNPAKDIQWLQEIARFWQMYRVRLDENRIRGIHDPRVEEFRWMLEELRVSLWAQQLKTPFPVSFKRMEKYWSEIR